MGKSGSKRLAVRKVEECNDEQIYICSLLRSIIHQNECSQRADFRIRNPALFFYAPKKF